MATKQPQAVEEKLNACVPHLTRIGELWAAHGLIDAPLLIACATPNAAILVRGEGWPDADACCGREAAAEAVIAAVQGPVTDDACGIIAAGISLLLGPDGRALHLANVARIRGAGQIPVLVYMLADTEIMTLTTVGVPRPTMH